MDVGLGGGAVAAELSVVRALAQNARERALMLARAGKEDKTDQNRPVSIWCRATQSERMGAARMARAAIERDEDRMKLQSLAAAGIVLMGMGIGAAHAQSLSERLAAADPAEGAKVFNKCRACHTIEEGGPIKVGPNLWGVIGRPVASFEGFSYSDAMLAFGGTWTVDRLDTYLVNPRKVVPGTKMAFVGLSNPEDRANLIAYLNQNSSTPVDLAAAAAAAGDGAPAQ